MNTHNKADEPKSHIPDEECCDECDLRNEVRNKITWYPSEICRDCGYAANLLTCLRKYKARPIKNEFEVSTLHKGRCEVCGIIKHVTEPRDFFYPDLRAIKCIKRYLETNDQKGIR